MAEVGLEALFKAFAKFGDSKSDGKAITLSQSDKWMKQAKVIDKVITTTDTGIIFGKFKSRTLTYENYLKFIDDLANSKKMDPANIKAKLIAGGLPGLAAGATQAETSGAVDRLTDTANYTGTHAQRFDKNGKGKGKEGREEVVANDGYVQGYKDKDTYDKKNKN